MRLVFMGTPDFSVPALTELIAVGHDIAAVYTQPARRAGRGQKLRVSPVEALAQQHGLLVRTPENFKSAETRAAFQALDLEVAVVVAYGLILPLAVLQAPRLGCLNLHGSLLPRWRGAAPVQRAIMAGDQYTGVQVMQMEKGLDTGPVMLSETVEISPIDTSASLHGRLSRVGADLLPRALAALSRGALVASPQAEEGVTYAHKISPDEAQIDWSRSAQEVDCHIRGLSPFPGSWFNIPLTDGKNTRCKALLSSVGVGSVPEKYNPGTVLSLDGGVKVACGQGVVVLHKVQKSGKNAQDVEEFLRGTPLSPGQELS